MNTEQISLGLPGQRVKDDIFAIYATLILLYCAYETDVRGRSVAFNSSCDCLWYSGAIRDWCT